MIRVLLLAGIVWAVFILARLLLRQGRTAGRPRTPVQRPLVRCARCGTYTPVTDAVRDGDRHYCSTEHRDSARREGAP